MPECNALWGGAAGETILKVHWVLWLGQGVCNTGPVAGLGKDAEMPAWQYL